MLGNVMSDLIAASLGMSFGASPLFEDVSLTVDPGDRIALVGPNGAGKTTLLRVLSGQLSPTQGSVQVPAHVRVTLHDQRPARSADPLRTYASPAHIVDLETQLRALEHAMADGSEDAMRQYEHVRAAYDAAGGEAWESHLHAVLRGLGFTEEQFDQPLDTFSGGELTRASLARALASRPDILLLDEPTNHLDMEAIDWLSEYIASHPGGVVLVSHDRWFIESACTSVVEIAYGRSRRFKGSFVEYRAQQALEAVTHQRQLERWQDEMARLQRFVDKFSAGTRAKQAQSRVKMLDRIRSEAPQYADMRQRKTVGFRMPVPERSGATVLDVRGIELGFPEADRVLVHPTDFVVERGEKIALLGPNGSGKSTMLSALAAACIPLVKRPDAHLDGEIRVGYSTTARLISQHDTELADDQSLLGNMHLANPGIARREAMSLLGLFGFAGDDADRLVHSLSGGERRRLLLATALTGSANLLLIDEPTNHLDIESREALEAALATYEGTVILISHDRALIEGVATRTMVLHDQQVSTVLGGYTQAREVLTGQTPPAAKAETPAATSSSKTAPNERNTRTVRRDADRSGSPRARGRRTSSAGPKVRRPGTIERELEALETQLGDIQQQMLDPEVYTSPEKSAAALTEHQRLEYDIAQRYEELERSLEHYG